MTDPTALRPRIGASVFGASGRRLGIVDSVFVDYLLVRTAGLVPVDLYLPVDAATIESTDRVLVDASADEAYERWHRPLKSVAHD
jgi:hypothetical protein